MTMSKRCNKMTFLIWSLLHLINPEIFFPPDFSRAQLWLTRGEVSVCHPAVGVCGGRGAREAAGARRGGGGKLSSVIQADTGNSIFAHNESAP